MGGAWRAVGVVCSAVCAHESFAAPDVCRNQGGGSFYSSGGASSGRHNERV